MKKKLNYNIIPAHIQEHSSIYLFTVVLFLMGVIFGAIIVNSLSFTQKEDLFYYLSQFFGQVATGKVAASRDLFYQSFFHNSKFIGLMWLLGLSVIGLPIILVLLFMKGMVVGFTVGFLVNQMAWKGFFLSFVSVLPQNFIIIPLFIIIACMSVSFSIKMIRRQFVKNFGQESIGALFGKYFLALAGAIVFIMAAAGIEAYLSPVLMRSIIESVTSL